MGGKTGTTTSSVAIPPEVLARYNSVNAQAQATAGTPFQQYSTDPNAFVAPLNEQQNAGINNINQQANAAQPGYQAAMAGTANAAQGFNAQNYQQGVQAYMNPYLQNAMGSTAAYLQNQNQQQQNQLQGNAISSGAFGGDRGNVAQAALMGQQNLAMGQTLGQMANQGYQQSAQNYMTGLQQQGALANQYGNLAGQAQQMGLAGAQAQLGAGTLGQQTTQAGQTALYNQFQQQQAYPFQVAQFLANIAEGTGALSGSTTTQTGPQSWFSDVRLKHDIKRVGTAKNGLPIYTFKYKGDDTEQTHVGYMAQDVEKVHPEAVGESHGYKTVDYDKASEPLHRASGGVVANSEGGAVAPHHMGEGFAVGGDVISPSDLSALLAAQQQSYAPFQQGGLYGGQAGGTPGGKGYVPAANNFVAHLQPAQISNAQQGETFMGDLQNAENIGDRIKKANDYRKDIIGHPAVPAQPAVPASNGVAAKDAVPAQDATGLEWLKTLGQPQGQAHGGVVGYASGGGVEPYQTDDPMSQVVSDTEKDKNQHGLMTAQNPTGQPSSTLGDLGKIASLAALPGEIASGAGAAASGIGSLMAMLAPIGLATGGVVPREHHAGPDDTNGQSNVVGNGDQTPAPDDYTVNAAKELLRQREGLLTNAKYDTNAYRTGYGSDTVTQPDGTVVPVKSDTSITKDDAERDLARRTGITQNDIQSKIGADAWAKLTPDARVALTSTAYNYGSLPDSVAGATKSGNPADIATAINNLGGDNEGINAVRRSKEASLIDPQGKYDPMAPQPKASAATAPNATAPKSFGDALMEKAQDPNVLLSILSGLGTMAGSNSRYLGAAILQGIGGAADTYKGLQQQAIERMRANAEVQGRGIEALKYNQGRFVPRYDATGTKIVSYQDMNGGPDLSPEDMGKMSSNIGSNFGLPAAIGNNPSAGTTQGQGPATEDIQKDVDLVNNANFGDASTLQPAAAAAYRVAAKTSDPRLKETMLTKAGKFTEAAQTAGQTGLTENFNIQATAQRDQLNAGLAAQNLKQETQAQLANMFDKEGKPLLNQGPLGDQLNRFAGIAKQAGLSQETIKAITGFDPAKGDTVEKLRTSMGTDIGQIGDANTVSGLNRIFASTPGNQIVPEASKWIAERIILPKADSEINTAKIVGGLNPRTDKIQERILEEKRQHPWFQSGTEPAGAPPEEKPKPVAEKPKEQPVPLPLIGKPNIQRSQSTGNYFDGKQWYSPKGEKIEGNVAP